MDRTRSFSSQLGSSEHKTHGSTNHTSSAFSACANPNEDWTKISDLGERRRIQNRIAQRNYRKKLKKRLEDLERRANSSSASPEQKPRELDLSQSPPKANNPSFGRTFSAGPATSKRRTTANHTRSVSDFPRPTQFEDRSMFSQQHMRQLSASPPPFSFSNSSYGSIDSPPTSQFSQPSPYMSPPFLNDVPSYSSYLPPLNQGFGSWQSKPMPIKQECFGEDEMSPFSMSYASMAGGVDMPCTTSYPEQTFISTPDLSDTYEFSSTGSPAELTVDFASYPLTPLMMPLTPPLQTYEV